MPDSETLLGPLLIIPAYVANQGAADIMKECIVSIQDTTDAEVLIVDDCSPATEIADELYSQFDINVIRKSKNSGFANSINYGLVRCIKEKRDGVLVNADMIFDQEKNWLKIMQETEGDIIGGLLLYPSGIVQHGGVLFSTINRAFDHIFKGAPRDLIYVHRERDCPVTGALQYIRLHVLEDIGIYSEEYPMAFEDVDYCLRALSKGYRCVYNPKVIATHHESAFRFESEKHKQWHMQSLLKLTQDHKDKNFYELNIPTLMESRDFDLD